jgi:hypothetical protein
MKEPKKFPNSILKKSKKAKKPYKRVLDSILSSGPVGRSRTFFGNYFKEMAEWKTGMSMTPAAKRMFDCMLTDFLSNLLNAATGDELSMKIPGRKKKTTLTTRALTYAVSDLFGKDAPRLDRYIGYKSEHLDSAWPSEAEEKDEELAEPTELETIVNAS